MGIQRQLRRPSAFDLESVRSLLRRVGAECQELSKEPSERGVAQGFLVQPELPFTGRIALDFDLGVQGEQHKATDGQRGGFESGRVIGQEHGAVDHGGEFGAGGGQVGEGGSGEVTVAGWWGAGSEVGPQVGVVGGVGEGGVSSSRSRVGSGSGAWWSTTSARTRMA